MGVALILLVVFGLAAASYVLLSGRQRVLDSKLVVALEAVDVKSVRSLLSQGANANVAQILNPPIRQSPIQKLLSSFRGAPQPVPDETPHYRPAIVLPFKHASPNAAPIVKVLLEHGGDPNARDRSGFPDEDGKTALILAAGYGDTTAVQLLLEHGADPNLRDQWLDTALLVASGECAKLLIEKGARMDLRDRRGQTPLMLAAQRRDTSRILLLLSRGADMNARDGSGRSTLMYGCIQLSPPLTELLLAHGADVNAVDEDGRTPLMWAAGSAEPPEEIAMLLRHGARARARDKSGRTAYDQAVQYKNYDVLHLLKTAMVKEASMPRQYKDPIRTSKKKELR